MNGSTNMNLLRQKQVGLLSGRKSEHSSSCCVQEFYIDLDLTTLNQNVKPTTANRRKRLNDIKDGSASKKSKYANHQQQNDQESTAAYNLQRTPAEADYEIPNMSELPIDQDSAQVQQMQILDLTTNNPVISYGDQLYSCKWMDIVGTTMFFSYPQETALYDPALSTPEFELIGTSRIKLAGIVAKVTPMAQESARTTTSVSGQRLGTIRRANAKLNADLRKQAGFLEQLMNVKRNRGESDNVHVAMNEKIAKACSAGTVNAKIGRLRTEIEELNRKAVRGDAEALEKIEDIYLGQEAVLEEHDPI